MTIQYIIVNHMSGIVKTCQAFFWIFFVFLGISRKELSVFHDLKGALPGNSHHKGRGRFRPAAFRMGAPLPRHPRL